MNSIKQGVEGRHKYISCSDSYLLERVLEKFIDLYTGDEEVNLVSFKTRNYYYGFDFEKIMESVKRVDRLNEKLDLKLGGEFRNGLKFKGSTTLVFNPSVYIKKRYNQSLAVKELQGLIKRSHKTYFLDRRSVPYMLKESLDSVIKMDKLDEKIVLDIFEEKRRRRKEIGLPGQTNLSEFQEFVKA